MKSNENNKYDIICLDIERFKLINDLFGIKAGDELLKYVANMGLERMGNRGICGRIGSDKFAYLINHRDSYNEDMFTRVMEDVNGFPINISVNICYGIYNIEDTSIPINVMCDRAMIACSSVKGKYGIHYAFYTDRFRQNLLSEQTIVDGMNEALRDHQFEVYYQPKYDLSTEMIAGAEALVRWNHPKNGLMYPGDFIPLFEKNGFIIDLDIYIWESVCKQLRYWINNNFPIFPISVNVSRTDIYNPNLENVLLGLIRKYELDPQYLHLEITETAYTENPEQIIEAVIKLRNRGFIIEMDDFGTGYSSLNMLSELPIHILKLDMRFLQNESSKRHKKNILSFIVSLAKWLELQVVAEGVETKQQVETLKSMDCNYAQGFYYAKPMTVKAFQELLSQNSQGDAIPKHNKEVATKKISIQKSQSDRVMVVVDDSEINRVILSKIFHNLYNIVEASDGKIALDYIQANYKEIDIILLDLVMPVMDGFQVLEKLKNDPFLKNISVIITSQPSENSEARALSIGASDFIAKPYSQEVSLRRVSNVMAQSKLHTLQRERDLAREVEKMRYKAEHDYLTGLYNRTAMETRINNFFVDNETYNSSLFMLDIDCFKSINDTFGHNRGDEFLIQTANILLNCFGDDDIVARFGGDEFAVFVPYKLTNDQLEKKAKTICEKLEMNIDGVMVSASIGICNSPLFGSDYQTLYRNADSALLASKRLGKNQYKIYDNQMEMPSPCLQGNMEWLLDETSDAIVICDVKNYEILYLNEVAASLSGLERKSCIGKKCYQTLWHREKPCEHCISYTKLSNEYYEQRVSNKETNKHYIIRDKLMEWRGNLARIQYIQDDTQSKKYCYQLQQTHKTFLNILSFLQTGFIKCRLDKKWTIVESNEKFYELIGYSKEEFDNKFDGCLIPVLEPSCFKSNQIQIQKLVNDGDQVIIDSCLINCQNQLVNVSSQIVINIDNNDTYFYCTFTLKEDEVFV